MDYFYNVYKEASDHYNKKVLPSKEYRDRNTIAKEISYQKDMKSVEKSSVNECTRLHTFRNLPREKIASMYADVKVKPGFSEFYRQLIDDGMGKRIEFELLSVNWTSIFIHEYFEREFADSKIKVHSNELQFDSNDLCTGTPEPNAADIRTGYDKLVEVKKLATDEFMYVGDSSADVLPMIYSDFAVIMKGGSAAKQLNRMGFHVTDISTDIIAEDDSIKFLQVDDWFDILWILGPRFSKI
ncbi:DEKNAAC102652 [Brettanomyces naardenensis]|uniref:DEKNAAC102652 n=1 Tax=Brettanomyces naardenensis TaxID=13370 RepID=A0A448YK64_BRENA|nr:DEKNAAC102652 [Brettanomyces naardenensis]